MDEQKAEIPADGLYRVRRGDSLHAIAFEYGLDYRDIARWNSIRSPYTIYPDQVLRLKPPTPTAHASPPASKPAASPASRPVSKPAAPAPARPAPSQASSTTPASAAAPAEPEGWLWPVKGPVLSTFSAGDPARNGVDIGGRVGEPVVAAAAGQVVYSGNGLIGYGELVIVKHSERMLSAYAHNRRRLVQEGEQVRRGQKIAELGRDGRDRPLLHFEIRRDGKPVNPLNYLPKQ